MSLPESRGDGPVPSNRRSRRLTLNKRTWGALAAAFALVTSMCITAISFADNASGCDFASSGTTESCSSPLSGSTFAGGDGNLQTSPTTFGTTDWENVTGLNKGIDLASGSGDNAFGQGTKEDSAAVTVVDGSIPPNKSDLSRFYESSEFANGSNFLYLGWERTNVLGSANMDFEINQKTQPDLTTPGPKTLNRTAGDLLVTFDFTNGGGKPTLNLLRWLTSATVPSVSGFATNTCLSANSFPCWGDEITLNSTNSIGAVNNLSSVTDPIAPNAPRTLPALTFGETAINLTAAGVFPTGTCTAFGSAFLKSRSSASFPAEVKDFVAPVPVNISNCGSVKIIKHTDPRGVNQVFSYTSNLPAEDPGTVGSTPQGGVVCSGNTKAGVQADGSFCLNDGGNTTADNAANTVFNNALQVGTYTVTEGADPTGFKFKTLACSGGTTSISDKKVTITLQPNDAVVCTYTNQRLTGAIKVTKTSVKSGGAALAGAKFAIKGPDGTALTGSPFTTNSNGVVCLDGLTALGNYTVTETSAPTGYAIDDTTDHTVNVTGSNATCADSSFGGQSLSFTDTPLTDISANATSQATGGTKSQITCTDASGNTIASSGTGFTDPADASAKGLKPGIYTCKIEIDP